MAIYDHPSLLFYCGLLVDVSNDLSIKQVPIVFRPFDRFIRCEFYHLIKIHCIRSVQKDAEEVAGLSMAEMKNSLSSTFQLEHL